MKRLLLAVGSLLILVSVNVKAETIGSVWEVTKGNQRLFLGGTIHLLSPADYPLPKGFDIAYDQSDVLVFETDVSQMHNPSVQHLLVDKTQYKDGTTLKKALKPETYQQLSDFLNSRGSSIQTLESFKPGMATMMLTLNEIARLGQSGTGVDEHYNQRALADNKPLLFLETIEQQIDFLANMGAGQEDELVLYTLDELGDLGSALHAMKTAWREGNNHALIDVALTPWQTDFPSLYQSLLVKRNQNWLPQIEAMLKTPQTEYVLVGALHLVGNDGVIELLQSRGYQVSQIMGAP